MNIWQDKFATEIVKISKQYFAGAKWRKKQATKKWISSQYDAKWKGVNLSFLSIIVGNLYEKCQFFTLPRESTWLLPLGRVIFFTAYYSNWSSRSSRFWKVGGLLFMYINSSKVLPFFFHFFCFGYFFSTGRFCDRKKNIFAAKSTASLCAAESFCLWVPINFLGRHFWQQKCRPFLYDFFGKYMGQ